MREIVNDILSLVHLKGIIHREDVINVYNEHHHDALTKERLDRLTPRLRDELDSHYVEVTEDYFMNASLATEKLREQLLNEQQQYPSFIPSKELLRTYKNPLACEQSEAFQNLSYYISERASESKKEEIEDVIDTIQLLCEMKTDRDDIVNESLQAIKQLAMTIDESELRMLILALEKETQKWAFNGRSRQSLDHFKRTEENLEQEKVVQVAPERVSKAREEFFKTNKKVGRNEPCPCGSGKKYKKCCIS
ncbi:MAG TPA: SEC-C metal-binding domain-containing protein [Bacillota bacterium]|nr:SEC-C metal-binding domain-containing protein [Bacillota bacterium]